MKKVLQLTLFMLISIGVYGQADTIITSPPLTPNNGQSGVTFEFESNQPVNIINLENVFSTGASSADLWMRIGGVLHPGATAPNITTANGWSQVITGATVTGANNTNRVLMDFGGQKIAIPANTRIGFFISGSTRYQTGTAADQTTFTDGVGSVYVTDNIAFGGGIPSPTFNPRRFVGAVIYELGVTGNCTPFTNFAIDSISGTVARVKWTPGTGNTSFSMEYGPAGFTPGTGTTVSGSYPGAQPPVILTGLSANTTYDVYFEEYCNSGSDTVGFPGPQSFTTTKLCAPPNSLAITNILSNQVDVSWMYPGSATDFDIIYGPVGFDPTTAGTSVTVTSSPHTLTGLNPATAYDAYLVANCGVTNGYSDTIGPEFFFTNCAITTAPFTEKFDNATWVASGNNAGNSINPCWTATPDMSMGTEPWKWMPRSTGPTSGNGPLNDYTGGNFLYCEASGSTAGDVAEIITPLIDVSGLTTPALYFMQHRFYTTTSPPGDMDVEVSNDFGTTWNNVYSITGNTQSSNSDPWELVFVNLGAYIGDTIQLKFIQTSVGCCGDAAIDSVVVDEAPLCPWPTNVAIPSVTSTTADFSWSDPTGTSWDIEWGPCGYTQGTGSFVSATTNPYTATGLAPNTCYDLYIRSNCSAAGNGNSIWIGPVEFRTACAPFTAPFSDNFDANPTNIVPNCWSAVTEVQTGTQAVVETYSFLTPNSPPNHIRFYNGSGNAANGDEVLLISPEFSDLTVGDKRVQFFAYTTTTLATSIIVGTIDAPDTSGTFSPIDTVMLNQGTHSLHIVDVDLPSGYNGTDKYVALKHGMDGTFRTILIDDFSYGVVPSCNPPLITSLGVAGTGVDRATVYWAAGSDGDETHIEWGTPGFTPGTGSYLGLDSVAGSTDTFNITGLSPQTTYEYYIADSCAGGSFSPWVGPISFTTQCNILFAPLVEDFDGTSWVASGNNAGNMLDPCWASSPDVSLGAEPFKWIPRSTGPTSGNGPLNDLTGGNFMYVEASGSTAGDVAYLYSPLIDVSALTSPALYFWQHRYYTATSPPADMDIEVTNDNGATWTNVYNITGNTQTSAAAAWVDELVNLPQFVGDTIQIRFIQTGLGCCGDAAIDSVAIDEAPSCPDPGSLQALNVIDTSALLSWVGAIQAGSHEVWFGPQGFFQGTQTTTGTKVTVVGANSLLLDTISDATCYEFLVRGICGPGDTSNWVGPVVFCTPCRAFNAPYFEDFDAMPTGAPPTCFEAILVGSATQFSTIQVSTQGGARSAPNQVWMDNYTNTETMLISPLFADMTDGDKWVAFYAKQGAAGSDQIIVGTVPSSTSAANFSPLDTFILSTSFARLTTDLTAANGYNGTDQFVAIQHASTGILRDIYLDDFLYSDIPTGDLDMINGGFMQGPCLSNNDSIYLEIFNAVTPVDFSMTTLNVTYEVTGPANTNGTVAINSGQLLVGDTLRIELGGIDLSQVGVYNLKAWMDTSAINQIPGQDTINGITVETFPNLLADPQSVTVPSIMDSTEICVESSFFGGGEFLITEQCQFKTTSGSPVGGWPAYLTTDDYIEITGVPGADLGGITLEQYNTTGLAGTHTFPTGTFLSPNGTAIIAVGQLGTSTPSPSDFYYHGNGTYTGLWSSSTQSGRILRAPDGTIIDAVISNAFTWPAVAGVTAADWSGTVPATGGSAGNRLEGPDLNSGTGWIASATSAQDPNVVNNLVPAPKSAGAPGLQWTLNGNVVDTLPCITVGPFASAGVYLYIASFSNACGSFSDTVVVTVLGGSCDAPTALDTANVTCSSADLLWTSNTGASQSWIEYGPAGFTPLTGAGTIVWSASPYNVTGLMPGTTYDFYVADTCAMDTSNVAGPFSFTTKTGTVTAGFTFNLGTPGATSLNVTFDGSSSVGATSYDWDFGDGNTGTGQSAMNPYTANGTYIVTLTVTGPCGVDSIQDTVIIAGIGLAESILNQTLEIYPNPAKTEVSLSFNRAHANARIALLDLSGKELMVREINNAGDFYSGRIDLSELSDGVYMLQISDGEVVVNRRLIKR